MLNRVASDEFMLLQGLSPPFNGDRSQAPNLVQGTCPISPGMYGCKAGGEKPLSNVRGVPSLPVMGKGFTTRKVAANRYPGWFRGIYILCTSVACFNHLWLFMLPGRSNQIPIAMNWKKVDLNSEYECSRNLIENLRFDTLLLEIECNLPEINEETVRRQFEEDLQSRIDEAREIFNDNIKRIVKKAKQVRAIP